MTVSLPGAGGAPVGGPTVLRILLGAHLRRLREHAGISREDAGYHIRASGSKISRMELGRVSFKERDVIDLDATALGRGDEPIGAVRLTAQNGGEQLDEGHAADWRSGVEPSAVTGDPHIEIAKIAWQPPGSCAGLVRRGFA